MFTGSVMLSICSSSCVLYSAAPGAKRVYSVPSWLRMRLSVCMHDWMFAFAMMSWLCVDVMVMSSA